MRICAGGLGEVLLVVSLPLILGPPIALGCRRWGAGCRGRLSTLRLSSLRRPGEPRRAGYTAFSVSFSTDGVIWGRNGSLGLEPRARAGLGSRESGAFEPFGEDLAFRAGLAQVQLAWYPAAARRAGQCLWGPSRGAGVLGLGNPDTHSAGRALPARVASWASPWVWHWWRAFWQPLGPDCLMRAPSVERGGGETAGPTA